MVENDRTTSAAACARQVRKVCRNNKVSKGNQFMFIWALKICSLQDDGVVTSLVTGADGKNFLLILDASTFEELGRAKLPYGITYGFHNQFYT